MWPKEKLSPIQAKTKPGMTAVLLTTGAMNPIHLGHVAMMHSAADRLRAAGYDVRGAYVSPSHDAYVQPKSRSLGTIGLSSGFRLAVADRAVASNSLVSVASWEAKQDGGWPDFPVVCKALQEDIGSSTQVFYVCGTDHASKCALWHGMGDIGVVVVPRAGEEGGLEAENPKALLYVAGAAEGDAASFSSTKVRAALVAGDLEAVTRYLGGAAELLLKPNAEEHAAFASDYAVLAAAGSQ
jgi:nicotinic acid mononucleotide adenylyltransferase